MKYIIYAGVALLILWAVVYLVRHVRRQLRGEYGCGGDCGGGEALLVDTVPKPDQIKRGGAPLH